MLKWIILAVGAIVLTVFVVKIIKVMLKTEKESKQPTTEQDKPESKGEYIPQEVPIDIHSSSAGIVTDMSAKPKTDDEYNFDMPSGFTDLADDEFFDYSAHMHSRKGRRRKPVDFDLDGEMADDFEYIPSTPDFSYLNRNRKPKKKPIEKELNDLPTELKVLMLSDIFDKKYF